MVLVIAAALTVTGCWSSYWGECHWWNPSNCPLSTIDQKRQTDYLECDSMKLQSNEPIETCMNRKGWVKSKS